MAIWREVPVLHPVCRERACDKDALPLLSNPRKPRLKLQKANATQGRWVPHRFKYEGDMTLAKLTSAAALIGLGLLAAGPGLAAGDAAKGEKTFAKCKACHAIVDASGTKVVKGGAIGPNLFGVVGRTMGTYPDYGYGDSMIAAGAAGGVWTEELIAEYVVDPSAFLKKQLSDDAAKGKMAFKLKDGGADVAAYLATFN